MKFSKVALAIGLSMAMVSGFANAGVDDPTDSTDTGNTTETTAAAGGQGHGTVHFKGEIIDAPCSISPETADQTVDLGQIASAQLENKGKSTPVPFTIELQNCKIDEGQTTVTATWSGTADSHNSSAWGITGSASGASIMLRDASEKDIVLGQETSPTTLAADSTTIAMSAYLQGNGENVVPGTFTGVADFVMNYQ